MVAWHRRHAVTVRTLIDHTVFSCALSNSCLAGDLNKAPSSCALRSFDDVCSFSSISIFVCQGAQIHGSGRLKICYLSCSRHYKTRCAFQETPKTHLRSQLITLTNKMIPSKRLTSLCIRPFLPASEPSPAQLPSLRTLCRTGIDPTSECCFESPFPPIFTSSNA